MHSTLLTTPGLLVDAELAYRREQLSTDLSAGRRTRSWFRGLRRSTPAAAGGDLTLAA